MRVSITFASLLFFSILSCGSNRPVAEDGIQSGLTSPDDPVPAVYREAVFTVDQHLIVRDEIDWETAVHIPSIQVTYDDEGRITEAAGLWMGRLCDQVNAANLAPVIRITYDGNIETLNFLWSDGEPFNDYGVFGYKITRSDDGVISTLEYLAEDGTVIHDPSGFAWIQIEDAGDGWYIETFHDENGALIPLTVSGAYCIRQQLNSLKNQIATENSDSLGELLPLFEDVYRTERKFDSTGHLIERINYDSNGQVCGSPGRTAWETYEVSGAGLTTAVSVLDSDGSPATDYYGVSTTVFEYDEYGRITKTARFDTDGNPVAIAGVWATVNEYDDDLLQTTSTTLDQNGEPVDSNGFATVVKTTDIYGNPGSTSYYDLNGEPVFDAIGVHEYRFVYAAHNRLLELQIWNALGEPDTCSQGYHREVHIYDDQGNYQTNEYYDTDGNLLTD